MSFFQKVMSKVATSRPVTNVVSHFNAKEVVEGQKLLKNAGFENIKLTTLDNDVVNIIGYKAGETYSASLNYATRAEQDVWSKIVRNFNNTVTESVQSAKGTIDGVIKSLKTMTRTTRDGKLLSETTELQNKISGNHYKRIIDGSGKATYYKNVDGNFVELFPKK